MRIPPLSVILRTLFSRFLLACVICLGIIPLFIAMLLPARMRYKNKFLFWGMNVFYWGVIKGCFMPVTFEGKENIPDEPVVFASNHQSSLDIPLVGVLARGTPHIWLAKTELMQSRLLRFVLPRLAILVDTQSQQKAMRSLILLKRIVQGTDIDIMIFPEGARFTDEKVHPFFGGFVLLSRTLERPVVPVRIFGAAKAYPPDTFWVHYNPIHVVIGKPMRQEEGESDDAFKERVYQWFCDQEL